MRLAGIAPSTWDFRVRREATVGQLRRDAIQTSPRPKLTTEVANVHDPVCDSCRSGPAWRRYGCGRTQSIEAPFAAPGEPEIEEDEAVDDCQLPTVEQREKISWRMHHEIRDRHVAR